jgi:hypothetical protein
MDINISLGEALDRLSILEIKKTQIVDERRVHVLSEIQLYESLNYDKKRWGFLYDLILFVNKYIWDITNKIKMMEPSDPQYASTAATIFDLNQQRFRLKDIINTVTSATIKEQKSYAKLNVFFYIDTWENDTFFHIIYALLHFDKVSITLGGRVAQHYRAVLSHKFPTIELLPNITSKITIPETQYITDLKMIYNTKFKTEVDPIFYISGGLLGDFIHQLSIVAEHYYTEKRRGVLYISNIGDAFRLGLDKAYRDLKELVESQEYIEAFSIHNNNHIDYNLSQWRSNIVGNWHNTMSSMYNINWAQHKWLNVTPDHTYDGKILVNHSLQRWTSTDLTKLFSQFPKEKLIFVSLDNTYPTFSNKSGIQMNNVCFNSIIELVRAIAASELYIGNYSSPLTFAFALHHPTIIIGGVRADDNLFKDINQKLSFIKHITK